MALASGSLFNIQASATTGNTGGAGFNPANANFPTDLACDTNTGNTSAPVVSSGTYNFVAGDVGAWLYVKSGTNWTPGFYPIASVGSNKATLSAAIGAASQLNANTGLYEPSTVVGCATVGTPTGGTYGVNYSTLDTAKSTITDAASIGASTTLTSVTAPWTAVSVGNFFHLTTTGTGAHGLTGWYEIVSFTSAGSVATDRTTNDGTALVAGTGQTGGAGRLNGLEDAFFEMIPSASMVFVKLGTYTISGAINVASTNSTAILASFVIGYVTVWGDTCTLANRPVIAAAANASQFGQFQNLTNIICTTTTASGLSAGAGAIFRNCKSTNSSTSAGRAAISLNTDVHLVGCEAVSQNGTAVSGSTSARVKAMGCYIHDSSTGWNSSATINTITDCILEACITDAVNLSSATGAHYIGNCTFYGREAKVGTGVNLSVANSPQNHIENCIFYGLTTGIAVTTGSATSNFGRYNDFFNNTTDVTNWNKGTSDLAINPGFVGATQITGTTATTSGSVLTQSGGDFSTVEDNRDYLHVVSGTGVTVGRYLISSHTATTLTVNNALGTSSGGDVVYFVTTGHNFQVGTALRGLGGPTLAAVGGDGTSYPEPGAYQRSDTSGTSGMKRFAGMSGGMHGG